MNNLFKIDYKRLVSLMLPTFLRKGRILTFLKAMIKPVESLYKSFITNRDENLYKLSHNSQICYLQKALNDRFDNKSRRIYITDVPPKSTYVYTHAEKLPVYLGKLYLLRNEDFKKDNVDFKVMLPEGFDIDKQVYQLRTLIDFYKLASKRYKIEII